MFLRKMLYILEKKTQLRMLCFLNAPFSWWIWLQYSWALKLRTVLTPITMSLQRRLGCYGVLAFLRNLYLNQAQTRNVWISIILDTAVHIVPQPLVFCWINSRWNTDFLFQRIERKISATSWKISWHSLGFTSTS